ncbi:neuronal voltage-dependent calcium channel alpha 2acd domain-containing protein [Phthorimaea operculella]|nr:neuronal voltage-dependent calcium channel alpha 2acd domain-containing protein [Phthorimaea operculella]
MQIALVYLLLCFCNAESKSSSGEPTRRKTLVNKSPSRVRTSTTTTTELPEATPDIADHVPKKPRPIVIPPKKNKRTEVIPVESLIEWARDISDAFLKVENKVVLRETLLDSFKEVKRETRNGAEIVEKAAAALESLLDKRAEAAAAIGREAEKIFSTAKEVIPPSTYIFDNSIQLEKVKAIPATESWEDGQTVHEKINNCSNINSMPLETISHFGSDAKVHLDISSVKVASEVFDCDYRVLPHIYWSEELLHIFRKNYAQDAMTDFQYFCSAKGFMRHYPAASWDTMFKLQLAEDDEIADLYDCRLRPWYVAAGGAPRDILILFDFSGSMSNSSNKVHADSFVLALLTALTDDDQVNIIAFNDYHTESVIDCFDDDLVSANHVNSAALMTMLGHYPMKNYTDIRHSLSVAVDLLKKQAQRTDRPAPCQQAIVFISDSINENFTDTMRELDPTGQIRVFVIWLHDVYGLRDNSYEYSEWLACSTDAYFTELVTDYDVTEQVMQVLRVLERPLVHQRKERITVFSDLYAKVEDPRRSDYYWTIKENEEQAYRYGELRKNKKEFLKESRLAEAYERFLSLNTHGYYYEGTELDYQLQISVAVPVFDDTRFENITITLAEESQRNATRSYPANKLLGVAGVDIPIEHLKLYLPYYLLGAGGSLFIINHRGNIVIHDNLKPVFDGDILRPGYRTVDLLDLEQSAAPHLPRNYSRDWMEFRTDVIHQTRGRRDLDAKYIYENGMRTIFGKREYHWKRVKDYTVVVSLPKHNKRHAVPDGVFTKQLAEKAFSSLAEIVVHPDWLYCKHVEQQFDEPACEVRHFVMRRKDEPNFKMHNLNHKFSKGPSMLLDKTYICNEELIARLCKEAMLTEKWANDDKDICADCGLGSVTAFVATESGLSRWQQYNVATRHAEPPDGSEWPRGPQESWYKHAAAYPGTLVIHAPVTPIRKMRRSFQMPPQFTDRDRWVTAARTLGNADKGIIGVTGFHFYPKHLDDILEATTDPQCDEEDCKPTCDSENWQCVLIDESGWIVAGDERDEEELSPEEPIREHLARVYPHAMRALLDNGVFKLHWVHDYQAICLPPQKEVVKAGNRVSILLVLYTDY